MSKGISILVIEDEKNIRRILEYWLRFVGFKVYQAEDGLAGLKLARKKKPDLILLDWMMPEMDGLEVLNELKRNRKTKHTPVFMLTAKNGIGNMDDAYAAGADDYITKPFDEVFLGNTIKEKLEQYKKANACNNSFWNWVSAKLQKLTKGEQGNHINEEVNEK